MNKEIEWFCYHAVDEDLLTSEVCQAIAEAMQESDLDADLEVFAQAVVDNELCSDVDRLQTIMEMSVEEAKSLGFPPVNVFEEADDAAEETPVKAAPVPPRPPGAAPVPPRPPGAAPVPPRPPGAAPVPPRPPGAAPVPPPPRPTPPPTVSELAVAPARDALDAEEGQEWMHGWPVLEDAADASPDAAVALLNAFLGCARKASCSDVHISAGAFPFVRRFKDVYLVPGQEILSRSASEKLNLTPLKPEHREIYEKTKDLDYSYSIALDDRYRANIMLQRLGVAGSYRVIDNEIRSLRDLGFTKPEVIEKLTSHHQGLILVTGPAGCGKSTTLSALVDYINRNRHDHIITVEDPLEVIQLPIGCNITQRELHSHTRSFANALRAALREDPDIIVIGELRDLETIEMAISSSETGHLVIGTLHTGSASSTMDRILDVFPPNQQAQIRAMVAESLKGVICQQLLPNKDLDGVVMASEIMLGTLAVSNLIRDGKTYQLDSIIQTGRNIGMSTMEQSYVDLYMAGVRSFDQTIPNVKEADLVKKMQMTEAQRNAEGSGSKKKKKWF